MPVDNESVVEAVVKRVFQDRPRPTQLSLFDMDKQLSFGEIEGEDLDMAGLNRKWDEAVEREKVSRTRFAQHAIKPEEVAQELYEADAVLGNPVTVMDFVVSACERLGSPLRVDRQQSVATRTVYRLTWSGLPEPVKERVRDIFKPKKGQGSEVLITFDTPVPEGVYLINRLHPLTEGLTDYLLSTAFDPSLAGESRFAAARCGVIRTNRVSRRTNLFLLRLRHLITTQEKPVPLLSEELVVAAFEGRPDFETGSVDWLSQEAALQLLNEAEPTGNVSPGQAEQNLKLLYGWLEQLEPDFTRLAEDRASALLEAHRRVRQVTRMGRVTVRPQLPVDVLGMYVYLQPEQG